MHGSFFWYDVMTANTKAAQEFYREVIGWDTQDSGVPGAEYTLFTAKGQSVAGLMRLPEDQGMNARPCWTGYIAVDDVDAAAARLAREGGVVHRPPSEVPGVIRFAVVADPQGARFIIAKGLSEDAPMTLPAGTPGTVGWRELYAAEWPSAFAFYEAMFGWKKAEPIDMGIAGIYQIFATSDAPVGGMMTKPAMIAAPYWNYYFNVPALDDAATRVTSGGGTITNGPHQVPGDLWVVQCTDPQGALFSLVAPRR
jgi:predicted enzyme related to lactoylglutathione lyase